MNLIWTRGRADWDADQPALAPARAAGWVVVHAPCIETRSVAVAAPASGASGAAPAPKTSARHAAAPTPDAGVLVVTSVRAADELASQPVLRRLATGAAAIHTHGAATAARLAQRGLPVCHHPVRTAEELATHLATTLPRTAKITFVSAREPATDVDGLLRDAGLAASRLVCYETVAALALDARLATILRAPGVVCFASPSAAHAFAEALPQRAHLAAVAIGPTTAAALSGYRETRTAARNDLAALIDEALRYGHA